MSCRTEFLGEASAVYSPPLPSGARASLCLVARSMRPSKSRHGSVNCSNRITFSGSSPKNLKKWWTRCHHHHHHPLLITTTTLPVFLEELQCGFLSIVASHNIPVSTTTTTTTPSKVILRDTPHSTNEGETPQAGYRHAPRLLEVLGNT